MRSIVYFPGVWDMLHTGHISALKKAKMLGDVLVVGVQTDEIVEEQKGKKPIISTKDRIAVLESLKYVDMAVPYDDFNYVSHLYAVGANILCLSDTHKGQERFSEARKYIEDNGGKVVFLPYDHSVSSTKIKNDVHAQWGTIWESVAKSGRSDNEIVGHDIDKTLVLAEYIKDKLFIFNGDLVLDYGCGSGTLLRELDCTGIGIDISPTMIERARRNCPEDLFMVSDHIPLKGKVNHVFSWGVLHYLPSLEAVDSVIDEMLDLTGSVLLMELPDIAKREQRLGNRKRLGKILTPEPLYFSKDFFSEKGFEILTDDPKLTDNSEYSFSVLHHDPI